MKHISPDTLKKLRQVLEAQKKKLQLSVTEVEAEDPANDTTRIDDNASPDTDASEEVSMIRSEVVRGQLQESLTRVEAALQRMDEGTYGLDEDHQPIPVDRLLADPTATTQIA